MPVVEARWIYLQFEFSQVFPRLPMEQVTRPDAYQAGSALTYITQQFTQSFAALSLRSA